MRDTCHLSGLDPLHSSLSSPLRVKTYSRLLISLSSRFFGFPSRIGRRFSAPGEGLHDVDFRLFENRIGQLLAVLDLLSVQKNYHVLPQAPLVVQDIAAEERVFREDPFQDGLHRFPAHVLGRAGEVALEVSRKNDPRHGGNGKFFS